MPKVILDRALAIKETIKAHHPIVKHLSHARKRILGNPKHMKLLEIFLQTEDWNQDETLEQKRTLATLLASM